MAFSLHRFLKSILIKEEGTLTPKEIEIVPGGSAGTKTTLTSSQTANQTLTLPLGGSDTLVARATADTLTNKTIVAASNTITVAAINVTATALNAALTEIQANVDDHINATPNAHDAPAINVTPAGNLSSSNVQDALEELQTEIDTGATDLANHLSDATDAHDASAISNVPSGNLAATDVQAALNELQADVDTRILSSEKGAVSGVATLDGGGKVPSSQLPASVMQYQGQWNASTNTPTLTNGTGSAGDVYEVTVAGSTNFGAGSISFNIGDWAVYDGSVWEKSINSNEVVSVNGLTGAVTLDTDDVAEGSTNLYFTNGRAQTALSSHTSASSGVHGVTGSVVGTTDTQTLTNKDVDGGTASNTSRITLPKDTKSNLDGLTRKEGTLVFDTVSKKPYYDDGTSLKLIGAGAGSGIQNFITNGDAETSETSQVRLYNDGAVAAPINGQGAGATTITATKEASTSLSGTGYWKITKPASNVQGQGVAIDFSVDSFTSTSQVILALSAKFKTIAGSFTTGTFGGSASDVGFYVYDNTGALLINLTGGPNVLGPVITARTFKPTLNSTSYSLLIHFQTTSTAGWTIGFDDIIITPELGSKSSEMPEQLQRNKNYVKNTSAAYDLSGTAVSAATLTRDLNTTSKLDGLASFLCDASAQNGYCKWDTFTILEGDKTGNCEVSATFKGDASLYSLRLTDGTNTLYDLPLKNQTDWGGASFNYPCGATRDVRLVQTSAGTAPAVNIGRIYYGPATNLVNASVVTDTQSWTPTFNSGVSVGTGIDAFSKWTWTRRGEFFHGKGTIGLGTGGTLGSGSFTFTTPFSIDSSKIGTFSSGYARVGKAWAYHASAGRGSSEVYEVVQDALQPNRFKVSGRTDSGSSIDITQTTPTTWGLNDSLDVEFSFPVLGWTSSSMAVIPSLPSAPTIQRFTSGSGTYTTPQGVKYITVKMVGGGAGGRGGGTSGMGDGGAGGSSTFGTSLLTASGGAAVTSILGGAGGSPTISAPAVTVFSGRGNSGGGGGSQITSISMASGYGGPGMFGGNGVGVTSGNNGIAAAANSGAGGSGGTTNTGTAGDLGGGGGGGAIIVANILSPSASYSYSVGAGGSAGTAGTSGTVGGAGGSGIIIVEEYYHTENAPILVDENEMSVLYRHNSGQVLTSLGVIKFNVKVKDDFDSYNPTTGVFTAPFAGTYEISYTLFSTSATTSWEPYIRKNGANINRTRAIPTFSGGTSIVNNQSTAISSPYIVYLTKGETLDVYLGYAASAGALYTNAPDNWLTIKRVGN